MNLSKKLHNRLIQFLNENTQFTNWVLPSDEDLALEYKLEYENKGLGRYLERTMSDYGIEIGDNVFPDANAFIQAAKSSKPMLVDKSKDSRIEYRSNCNSVQCLVSLIKGYASYPKYRNEDTINALAQGFEQNKPMKMPIVLQFSDNSYRVMGGNTRMDMAFIKGVNPKVIVIDLRRFAQKD